ncbi:SDR family oxidoreductase [Amorphus coralli]|uniref:SDR family oxidoreductase n=1 Tax=Amorphus coralli TaxID=340680 RepID=UPI0003643B2D
MNGDPILSARKLTVSLPDRTKSRVFGPPPEITVVMGIDLDVPRGSAVGLVGESGSGKTTLGRAMIRLLPVSGGSLLFEGNDIAKAPEATLRPLRPKMQMIFQDPMSSLNPRLNLATILTRPFEAFGVPFPDGSRRATAERLLDLVGLPTAFAERYPHELSGGQRQRVGIARAIALEPDFIVADEIVSGLDVSTQAQILILLRELQARMGLTLVFISHDLSVVRALCDRLVVLYHGEVVEQGPCSEVFASPRADYTRTLLDAVPLPEIDPGWLGTTAPGTPHDVSDKKREDPSMSTSIKGQVVLVTGASGGIGTEFVNELVARGAAKVYAAARDPSRLPAFDGPVEPLALDITDPAAVATAAKHASDVTLLINNAGVNHNTSYFRAPDLVIAREEMEVNYFGTLSVARAFAPVLAANGGGAIVNMLSILARVNLPLMGSLCASKAASLSMTQALRAELKGQGTRVIGVMPGAIDTRMTADFPPPKMPPAEAVKEILDEVEKGAEGDLYPGAFAKDIAAGLAADPKGVEAQMGAIL